jgi:hypothetical protein
MNYFAETASIGNMVLRRIFGPKRDEIAGGWRALRI